MSLTLSQERMQGIERQRKVIRDKMATIQRFSFRSRHEYIQYHDTLVTEVEQLLAYAKFQAEQQKDLEGKKAAPLLPEEYTQNGVKQYWIKANRNSTLQFAYIRETPQAGKLVGTIDVRPGTVSSSMQGVFTIKRGKDDEGNHYFVVTADPRFNGTFTFINDGRRATVDVASMGEQRALQQKIKKQKEADRQPQKNIFGDAAVDALIDEWQALKTARQQELQQPSPDAKRSEEIVRKVSALQLRIDAVKIYRFITKRGTDQWCGQKDGVPKCEERTQYMVREGNLFKRTLNVEGFPKETSRFADDHWEKAPR